MIYLDNAATSFPKAPGVGRAVLEALEGIPGSPGRGSHGGSLAAARVVFEAREAAARFLGVADASRLAFTRNATEALNLALLGTLGPGDAVALGSLEHQSVMRPLRHLEATRGVRLLVIPFDALGRPDPGALEAALAQGPALFVFTAASNVTGALPPVGDLAARCARAGVPFCLDASQAVGHLPLSMADLGVQILCFPGHKGLLGPTGTGGLALAPGTDPLPLLRGGTGSGSHLETQPLFLPDRYESGTPDVPGLAGLGASLAFLEAEGPGIGSRERALTDHLLRGLLALPGVRAPGPPPGMDRAPVVSITVQDRDPAELALELDRRGVATRAGLHCAPAAHRSLGTLEAGGTLRFSPGAFNTGEEIQAVLDILEELLP